LTEPFYPPGPLTKHMAPRRARDVRADAERSFEQLYRGHRGDVYRAALRELGNTQDAEDVTQAAFVDAYRAVLRGTRPEAPRAWLLTIAENVRRRRFRTSLKRPREEPLDSETAPAAQDSNEQAAALLDALAMLTVEQREAFLLREIRGLSYDEIAQRTDSTVASVQMLLFRARKTLRDELEPPQVQGALLPLATLLSRAEAFSLTPRVAGAIGAAVVAVSVSASVPASAEVPPTKSAAPHRSAVVSAPPPVTGVPVKEAPAAKPAPRKRPLKTAPPGRVAAQPSSRPEAVAATPELLTSRSEPQLEPQSQPQSEPPGSQSQLLPLPQILTPPAIPLTSPAVPTPSLPPPPLLEPVVEPVLEGAGAAGAAVASTPPLPVLPLDPVPPVLP
jgi:RNA polymerase sigma-70 factor (ECF subfamily)